LCFRAAILSKIQEKSFNARVIPRVRGAGVAQREGFVIVGSVMRQSLIAAGIIVSAVIGCTAEIAGDGMTEF